MPVLFALFDDAGVEREPLLLPRREVALLRQTPRLAQAFQDVAVGRMRGEPALLEIPQLRVTPCSRTSAADPARRSRPRPASRCSVSSCASMCCCRSRFVSSTSVTSTANEATPSPIGTHWMSNARRCPPTTTIVQRRLRLVRLERPLRQAPGCRGRAQADRRSTSWPIGRIDRGRIGAVHPKEIEVLPAPPHRHRRHVEQIAEPRRARSRSRSGGR